MSSVLDYPPAPKVMESGMDRFIADGAHYRDLINLRKKIVDWQTWPHAWAALAAETEERGAETLYKGRLLTAADEFARAALYYHFAQYILFDDLDLKKTLHDEKGRVFMRGAHLFRHPIERVEFPFKGIEIGAYFRRPAGVTNPPVVLCIGGADTTKEDYLRFSDLCMDRGLATFAFDGPGQGETFFKMLIGPGFEDCISAAIDWLETREEVDSNRIGIVGRSLGGYLAPRAAAVEPRIRALACWGVLYDRKDLPGRSGIAAKSILSMAGLKTIEEGVQYFEYMDLDGLVPNIKCPVFVSHGGLDAMPIEGCYRFMRELPTPPEAMIWDDATHCCHDRAHIMRPGMADFFLQSL